MKKKQKERDTADAWKETTIESYAKKFNESLVKLTHRRSTQGTSHNKKMLIHNLNNYT